MPSSLETPVLQVDANVIHKVDTTNPQNLFSMWTVFARCADSVAQGRRLENLSWRLWTRETFCCEGGEGLTAPATVTLPKTIHAHRSSASEEVPPLSRSVESSADEEAVEFISGGPGLDIVRPAIRRQDSCASSRSRGKERHITSDDLEKMVTSIVQQKEPLTAPLPQRASTTSIPASIPIPPPKKHAPTAPTLERSGSTTTESPDKTSETPSLESLRPASSPEAAQSRSRTTVIRGFSPSPIAASQIVSQAPKSSLASIPEPREAPAPKIVQPKKQQAKFALGGSSCDDSYSDQGHSLEMRKQPIPLKKKMFQVGGSSEDDSSLRSALHSARPNPLLSSQKKQASFSSEVVTRTIPTVAVSDNEQSETDYVDESAIDDDDDSSDWEDSVEDSGKSSVDDKSLFQRVDSKANLTSRRSLITLMLAQNERSQRLGNNASQSTSALPRARTSPNGPSLVASPNDSDDAPLMMKRGVRATLRPINEVPRSAAQPIMATTNHLQAQAALSPRTTRRNMLATELTESLRRHLLWERSQKTQTANAVLKRRHTSHDVANLKQYPEKPYMKSGGDDVNASSWEQFLAKEAHNGYHSKGW